MTNRSALLASALEYASRGWAIFPVLPDLGKNPKEAKDGHRRQPKLRPLDWEQWATTDHTRITRTWERHPWGIAIACGPSNLLVIESRPADEYLMPGETHLRQLATRHGPLPATWTVAAPDGALTRYYQHPNQPLNTSTLSPHLQIRTHGHYVVAPPTTTPDGTWWLLQNQPVAPLPHWLAQMLT